jgi:hypothetical protein
MFRHLLLATLRLRCWHDGDGAPCAAFRASRTDGGISSLPLAPYKCSRQLRPWRRYWPGSPSRMKRWSSPNSRMPM